MASKCPKCHSENPDTQRFCGECGTQLPPSSAAPPSAEASPLHTKTLETSSAELAPGSTFAGRYHIVEELGRGGMGKVYRATDKKLNEEVALKLIRPEIALDKHTLSRFQNELKVARKISHPHVGRMYELMEEKGVHFITMEYVAGQNLGGLIRQTGQLTAKKAISIARQVLDGLSEAHRLGIVHRDLKPSNVIIDKGGTARIIDFGIARSIHAKSITGAGEIIGTPEYMSPEQVDGKPADARSDLYALGVILFEMATGQLPFQGETPFSVALKHKAEPPPDPAEVTPDIPAGLARVILRSLEKNPDKRYQTSTEFLADLESLGEAFPTTEHPSVARRLSTSKKITVEFTPKKFLIPAAALAVLVIAVVLLWHPWSKSKVPVPTATPHSQNSIAVISFENLTGDPQYDDLTKAVPNIMISMFEGMGVDDVVTWERLQDLVKQMGKDPDDPIYQETGFDACRRDGIAVLVTGQITKAGNIFSINIRALDVRTRDSLGHAVSQGQGEESILLSQIDYLAGQIFQKLEWALPKAGAPSSVAEFTTASMDAYKEFIKGCDFYEKRYKENARQALQNAVDIDPEFATAYLYLARVHNLLRNIPQKTECYEKAKALSERAGEKERLYIEAAYAGAVEKDPEKEFRILRDLVAKYPKEKQARLDLGVRYRNKQMFQEAITELDAAVKLDPDYGLAWNALAFTHMNMGELEKAAEYLRKYISLSPGDAKPLDSMGSLLFRMGRLDEAVDTFEEALKIKPDFGSEQSIAYIHAVKGDYPESLAWIDRFILNAPSEGLKLRGLWWRSFYYYILGRRDLAAHESDQVIENAGSINPYQVVVAKLTKSWYCLDRREFEQSRRLFLDYSDYVQKYIPQERELNNNHRVLFFAELDLRQKKVEAASERLENMNLAALESSYSSDYGKAAQFARMVKIFQAEVLLAQGKAAEVISLLEVGVGLKIPSMEPPALLSHNYPFEQDVLARAYQENGDADKAIDEYLKLITFDPESRDRRIRIPVYHYRLGKLYEEKGLSEKAAEQYQIFLDLWKDADPGIPEFEDAKRRLGSL